MVLMHLTLPRAERLLGVPSPMVQSIVALNERQRRQILVAVEALRERNYAKIESKHNNNQTALPLGANVHVKVPERYQRKGFGPFHYTAVISKVYRDGLYEVEFTQLSRPRLADGRSEIFQPMAPQETPTKYARNHLRCFMLDERDTVLPRGALEPPERQIRQRERSPPSRRTRSRADDA